MCQSLQQKLHLLWCQTCKMGPFMKVVGFWWGLLTNPIPRLLGTWPLFARIMFNDLLPTSNFFKVSLSSKFSFWRVSRSWHFMHELKLSWYSVFNLSKLQVRLSCSFFSNLYFLLIILHSLNKLGKTFMLNLGFWWWSQLSFVI